jgi:hypothetical protein
MKKYIVRIMALSMVTVTTGMFSPQGAALASSLESGALEQSFLEQRMPWLHTRLTDWQRYLDTRPAMDYVAAPADEEVGLQFSHSWATKGLDDRGNVSDPSVVELGHSSFLVKDAFVASRLLAHEEARVFRSVSDSAPLASNSRHFLYLLSGQEIAFESSRSRQEVLVSYRRSFLNKKLSLHVDCPLVRQEHNIDLAPIAEISRANRDALVDATSLNGATLRSALGGVREGAEAPGFYQSYSNMNNFLHHVLKDTGIAFEKRQEKVGLGDMRITLSYDQPIRYVDASHFGIELKLNTGKTSHNVALAEPALGDGCTMVSGHARLAWHRGLLINPFVKVQVGYSLPSLQGARVPYSLSYNGVSHIGDRMIEVFPRTIPFCDVIGLGGAAFTEYPETVVREFASTVHTVTMHKGLSCVFELGNTFERCFGKPMFATMLYRFNGQQQAHLSGIENPEKYALDVVTSGTGRRSHDVVLSAGYRLSSLCSIHGGLQHRFAGKNVSKETRVFGGVSLQF